MQYFSALVVALLGHMPGSDAALPLTGLTLPTSIAIDPLSGVVFIAELKGFIKQTTFNSSLPPVMVKNLTASVFVGGWHGLTSILLHGNFLYATFTRGKGLGDACADDVSLGNAPIFFHMLCNHSRTHGTLPPPPPAPPLSPPQSPLIAAKQGTGAASRPRAQVAGCPRNGALVRWPFSGGSLGADPPQELLPPGFSCSQFLSGGILQALGSPSDPNTLYVSTGVGALDDVSGGVTDFGQLGGGPCTAFQSAFGGHFSALDPQNNGGKVYAVSLLNATGSFARTQLLAQGLHNPWRMALAPPSAGSAATALFSLDTSGAGEQRDELNGPIPVEAGGGAQVSFGWPCLLGNNVPVPQFQNLFQSPCFSTKLPPQTAPFYTTPLRVPGVGGALSGIAFHSAQKRFYFADYIAGTVQSIGVSGVSTQPLFLLPLLLAPTSLPSPPPPVLSIPLSHTHLTYVLSRPCTQPSPPHMIGLAQLSGKCRGFPSHAPKVHLRRAAPLPPCRDGSPPGTRPLQRPHPGNHAGSGCWPGEHSGGKPA